MGTHSPPWIITNETTAITEYHIPLTYDPDQAGY